MGRGGLETMLMNYYRKMDRSKVQFDFLVHRDFAADYDQEILSLGGRIFHISRLVPWSRSYRSELKTFFKSHPEYQIVHVHQDCLSSVALKCAEECGIPVRCAHAHSSSAVKDLKYPIKLFYRHKIAKYATHLFACNQSSGNWMFCGAPFQIIKNAIDLKQYVFHPETAENMRASLGLDNKFVIGHVGRFRTEKNHEFLIRTFHALLKKQDNAVLLLVGDGEQEDAVKAQAQGLGIADKVLFLGARSDVPQLMQTMDVFVFPSLYEGLPLTMIEAQAAGLPCIISDCIPDECIITDLVTQRTLDCSPEAWADEILNYQGTPHKDTYAEICQAGFDISDNAQKLQKFYLEQFKTHCKTVNN